LPFLEDLQALEARPPIEMASCFWNAFSVWSAIA
jgi:hypothetical protein